MRGAPRACGTALAGGALVLLSAAWFILGSAALVRSLLGAAVASPSGGSGGGGGGGARADVYYALLVPLSVPVALVAAFLHWFAMKLYRHS